MKKQIPIILLSGLLLGGCSSPSSTTPQDSKTTQTTKNSDSSTQKSSKTSTSKATLPVHTRCTSQEDGVTLTIELEAPAQDQVITSATISLHIDSIVVAQLAGLENLDTNTIKAMLPSLKDLAKNIFGSYLGVDPNSFAMSADDTGILLTLSTTKTQELKKILDLDNDESLVFKDIVKELKSEESMTCS
ncbi:MAG: hypothetical protein K2H85_00525 [Allobaculum sp.]|nr:hypothetical protein [Allobaculum sp.]